MGKRMSTREPTERATRSRFASYLRARRASAVPSSYGIAPESGRRVGGLTRAEVAELAGISADYYTKLEQPDGPQASRQVVGALERAFSLTPQERDHLRRLAGFTSDLDLQPARYASPETVAALTGGADVAMLLVDALGRTLAQNAAATELLGDETRFVGVERSRIYRWFHDRDSPSLTPDADHPRHSRQLVGELVSASALPGYGDNVDEIVRTLSGDPEFQELWAAQPVGEAQCAAKTVVHPTHGPLAMSSTRFADDRTGHVLTLLSPDGR